MLDLCEHALKKGQIEQTIGWSCLQVKKRSLTRNLICWHLDLGIGSLLNWGKEVKAMQPVCFAAAVQAKGGGTFQPLSARRNKDGSVLFCPWEFMDEGLIYRF